MYFSKAGQGPLGSEVKKDRDLLGRGVEEKVWTVNDGFTYQKGSSYGRKPEMQAVGSKDEAESSPGRRRQENAEYCTLY